MKSNTTWNGSKRVCHNNTLSKKQWGVEELLNKSLFLYSLLTKVFSKLRKIAVEPLMSHGLFYQSTCYVSGPGNIAVVLLYVEDLTTSSRISSKIPSFVFWRWTGLERHEGEYDRVFNFGWTNPLIGDFI